MPPSRRDAPGLQHNRAVLRLHSQQLLIGGVALIVIALVALWMVSGLHAGTLRAIGPAMLPRWLAAGLGLCGVAIVISGFFPSGEAMPSGVPVRGPLVVLAAIFLFALTIRPLGLAFAGPATLILGGYATHEARFRELLGLACFLTAFCILLFGDMLNLPIPVFPIPLIENLPAGWSLKFAMRIFAGGLMAIGSLVVIFSLRRARAAEKQHNSAKGA